jgi:hypothetical protein
MPGLDPGIQEISMPLRVAPDEVDGPRTASVCQDEAVKDLIEGGRP